jgi:hypothetical protein
VERGWDWFEGGGSVRRVARMGATWGMSGEKVKNGRGSYSHPHNNCASGHVFPQHQVPGTHQTHRIGRKNIMRMGVCLP